MSSGALDLDVSRTRLPPWPDAVSGHHVQFYDQESFLHEVVAGFLGAGMQSGHPLLVVATEAHREAFCRLLARDGFPVAEARRSGQLTLLDARETLATFMVDGMPDWERFRVAAVEVLEASASRGQLPIRAYGEMVDLLCKDGNTRAALRLEEFWNELGKRYPLVLFCSYAMDGFASDARRQEFEQVCHVHTHVLPAEDFVGDGDPQTLRRQIGLLQQRSRALETELARTRKLEAAVRSREQELSDVLENLGILGHDLRDPVMGVATAASLLLRHFDNEAVTRPARRIASNAERMSRMIDLLRDFTGIRLGQGLRLARRRTDLGQLCRAAVEEDEVAQRATQVQVSGNAHGEWDPDRLTQLVCSLVGNARSHGQDRVLLRVSGEQPDEVVLEICNGGVIPPEQIATIFEPFRSGTRHEGEGPSGLGLGLYLGEQIVLAHGGTISVESSSAAGTRFIVRLPR
jgi:signal transduction histidine kinase